MANAVVYQPPSAAEWFEIATNPALVAVLESTAARAKTIAEMLSVDFMDTGHYARSFEVRMEVAAFTQIEPRAVAILVNTADYAADVEDAHHVLARTRDYLLGT